MVTDNLNFISTNNKTPSNFIEGALCFKSGSTYSPTQSPMQYHQRKGA